MKKITTFHICAAIAVICILYGTISSVANHVFYWHIFFLAAMIFGVGKADQIEEQK